MRICMSFFITKKNFKIIFRVMTIWSICASRVTSWNKGFINHLRLIISQLIFSLPVIPENEKSTDIDEHEDINQTKVKLRELMLMEKVTQLEKQLALFTTLPVTHDYETIQLNSCNIDDLVIAVYNEDYGSYKIIHKSSNYLHFVHSAIFKSHEQRLSFKVSDIQPLFSKLSKPSMHQPYSPNYPTV